MQDAQSKPMVQVMVPYTSLIKKGLVRLKKFYTVGKIIDVPKYQNIIITGQDRKTKSVKNSLYVWNIYQ